MAIDAIKDNTLAVDAHHPINVLYFVQLRIAKVNPFPPIDDFYA